VTGVRSPVGATYEQLEHELLRTWDAARIASERLEKPLCELQQLRRDVGEELELRLEDIEGMVERAAGELRRVVG
jgi:hypothetical protein